MSLDRCKVCRGSTSHPLGFGPRYEGPLPRLPYPGPAELPLLRGAFFCLGSGNAAAMALT